MDQYAQARCQIATNAALLACLKRQPASPQDRTYVTDGGGGAFSLRREIQLSGDYAFISSMKDDSNRIMAVCTEADGDGAGLTIRVAVNTGCLTDVVQELQEVANIMMRASRHDIGRTEADRLLFEKIIRMCSLRILSRLRSKHAAKTQKTKRKPKMPPLLLEVVSQCQVKSSTGMPNNAVEAKMIQQCIELNNVFEKLESSGDSIMLLQHLRALLSIAHEFDIPTLTKVLRLSGLKNSTLKEYLPRAIKKLGRYREIALDLANAARTTRHSLFKSITVRSIEPPNLSADNGMLTTALQDFEAVWSQMTRQASTRAQLSRMRENTTARYYKHIHSDCTKFKVHAEIQILCFYEQRPNLLSLRAICSSKNACYLCNLFLEIHGKFIVPQTHGKLYDRWALPPLSAMEPSAIQRLIPILHNFNRTLESTALQALKGEIGRYDPPNESVLAVHDPRSSHSTVVLHDSMLTKLAIEDDRLPSAEQKQPQYKNDDLTEQTMRNRASGSIVSELAHGDHNEYTIFLGKGDRFCKEVTEEDCIYVQTAAIHVQLSWSNDHGGDTARPVLYKINVEYLSEHLQPSTQMHCVDVNRLAYNEEEEIHFERGYKSGRIVCCKGEHKVCVTFEKVLDNGCD